MSRPEPRGWCPGALTPMPAGDGLIVRIKPRAGRLTAAQVMGLCEAAQVHGSGSIELTSRANLQIRGVTETAIDTLRTDLRGLDVLDDDPDLERRRNILVAPLRSGDVEALAASFETNLKDLPKLPAKFGFAVDCGPERQLTSAPADIRIERGASSALIVRAEGAQQGRPATLLTILDLVNNLAHWFATHRGEARRMPDAVTDMPAIWQQEPPAPTAAPLRPGITAQGPVLGAAFGDLDAAALADLVASSGAQGIITAPNRIFLLPGADRLPTHPFINDANDPILAIEACPGAPFCTAATVETRPLARRLATITTGPIHVSGCAKGCARPKPTARTLVGNQGGFDLVIDGCSWDEPARRGLDPKALAAGTEPF